MCNVSRRFQSSDLPTSNSIHASSNVQQIRRCVVFYFAVFIHHIVDHDNDVLSKFNLVLLKFKLDNNLQIFSRKSKGNLQWRRLLFSETVYFRKLSSMARNFISCVMASKPWLGMALFWKDEHILRFAIKRASRYLYL
jgi:hypothetical protein